MLFHKFSCMIPMKFTKIGILAVLVSGIKVVLATKLGQKCQKHRFKVLYITTTYNITYQHAHICSNSNSKMQAKYI